MNIKLNDGATFEIDENMSSIEIFEKIIRIMKYMTFGDIAIAKGMTVNLADMMVFDPQIETIVKEDLKNFFE